MNELISIIVPVYNVKPYLNKYGDNVEEKITVYYGTCVDCLNKKKC